MSVPGLSGPPALPEKGLLLGLKQPQMTAGLAVCFCQEQKSEADTCRADAQKVVRLHAELLGKLKPNRQFPLQDGSARLESQTCLEAS